MTRETASSFKIVCECGKKYKIRSSLEGKKARCRNCNEVLRLTADEFESQESNEEPNKCTECGGSVSGSRTKCILCGYRTYRMDNTTNEPIEDQRSEISRSILDISKLNSPSISFLAVAAITIACLVFFQSHLTGVQFLGLYFLFGAACLIGFIAAEANSCPSGVAAIISIGAFELLGVIRLFYGLSRGMHKFGFLLGMMALGGMVIWSFYDSLTSETEFNFSGGCGGGSGSSCGGGGGGGGGCGGCGG